MKLFIPPLLRWLLTKVKRALDEYGSSTLTIGLSTSSESPSTYGTAAGTLQLRFKIYNTTKLNYVNYL